MTNRTIKFANDVYSEDLVPATGGVQPKPLAGMNSGQLLSLYNLVASNLGRGSVKRFADTATGAKRTWRLLCEWADQPEEGPLDTGGETDAPGEKAPLTRDSGEPVVDTKGPVVLLSDADKRQVAEEAASRKSTPGQVADQLMKVASAGAAKTQAQTSLRTAPPASDNPAKDAEMPALRRALKPTELEPKNRVYARRMGSKQAVLVDLLSRPEGATFGELYDGLAAKGKAWKGVTIRSGLAWDINHIAGYGVTSELLNGEEFAQQGRWYEARRLGIVCVSETKSGAHPGEGYDPELKLAVYRLSYPAGMDAPLPHLVAGKKA